MTFKKKFAKNLSNLAFFTYLSVSVEFISTIILSRLLLPSEYGFVAIITLFSGFMQLFADNGIFHAIIRSNYGHTYHRHLFNLSVWIGLFLSIGLTLLAYPISIIFDDPKLFLPTIVLSFRFLFDSINYVPVAIQVKELNFKKTGTTKLITTLFTISFSIVLAILGFSYWALVIPTVFSPLVQFMGHYYHTRFEIRLYSFKAAKRIFKKVRTLMGSMTMNNTIGYWTGNADKMIIGKVFTQSDLGLYSRAFRFQQLSNQLISGVFSNALFPSLKKLQEIGGNIQKEYIDILGIITLINFPIYASLIAFPKEIVFYLWGNSWMTVADYLPFVGVIILFYSLTNTTTNIFVLFQKEKTLTKITLATSTINVLVCIIGSFTSMQNMLIFVTSSTVAINLPIYIYFGFYKSFDFNIKQITAFWLPKLLIGCALIVSIVIKNKILTDILLVVLLLHLFINQYSAIVQLIRIVANKIKKQ